jgi:hypothetical protein
LRALKRAPTAVSDVLPAPETTMREQACALALPLALTAMAMAAIVPSASFLIMGIFLADPLTMARMEASAGCRKVALR